MLAWVVVLKCPNCGKQIVLACPSCGERIDDKDYIYCPYCSEPFQTRKRWKDFTKKLKAPFKKAVLAISIALITIAITLGGGQYKPPPEASVVYQMESQTEQQQEMKQRQEPDQQQVTQVHIEIETQDSFLLASISGKKISISEDIKIQFDQPRTSENSDNQLINALVSVGEKVLITIAATAVSTFLVKLLKKKKPKKRNRLKKGKSVKLRIGGIPVEIAEEEIKQLILERSKVKSSSTGEADVNSSNPSAANSS